MTALDEFTPEGEPIHPYDFYDLLNEQPGAVVDVIKHAESPRPSGSTPAEVEADYRRNIHKTGNVVTVKGKKYFQTTTVPFKSKNF